MQIETGLLIEKAEEAIKGIDGDEDKPVNVTFLFAIIFDSRVCFYDVCSRYNDTEMVEQWLETNYPRTYSNGTRRAMTTANNFHLAIDHCRTLASLGLATCIDGKVVWRQINSYQVEAVHAMGGKIYHAFIQDNKSILIGDKAILRVWKDGQPLRDQQECESVESAKALAEMWIKEEKKSIS